MKATDVSPLDLLYQIRHDSHLADRKGIVVSTQRYLGVSGGGAVTTVRAVRGLAPGHTGWVVVFGPDSASSDALRQVAADVGAALPDPPLPYESAALLLGAPAPLPAVPDGYEARIARQTSVIQPWHHVQQKCDA